MNRAFSTLLFILFFFCCLHQGAAAGRLDSLSQKLHQGDYQNDEERLELYINISWDYLRRSADSTVIYANRGLELAEDLGDDKSRIMCLKNMGIGYDITGRADSSLYYMNAALNLAKEIEDNYLIAGNLNNLGLSHYRRGLYEKALEYYMESLEISEGSDPEITGLILLNIGRMQIFIGDLREAKSYFSEALDLGETHDLPTLISTCLYYIGNINAQQDKLEEADSYYLQAREIVTESDDIFLLGKIFLSEGKLAKKREQPEKARGLFSKANTICRENKDVKTLTRAIYQTALIEFEEQNYQAAHRAIDEGSAIARKSANRETVKDFLGLSAKLYAAQENYQKAYEFENKFVKLSDSLFNKKNSMKLNTLHSARNLQKKADEIALLTAQKSEKEALIKQQQAQLVGTVLFVLLVLAIVLILYIINRHQRNRNQKLKDAVDARTADLNTTNEELRKSNAELERFAFITSHDLREPLRNISGFTSLILRRNRNSFDEETTTYFNFIRRNTRQMHQLIEDIFEYSRIGKEEIDTTEVDLNEILDDVRVHLSEFIRERNAIIKAEKLPIISGVRSHLLTIFKNLIENGIKYNKSAEPIVEVRCEEKDGFYSFAIKDNGIGISAEYHDRVFKMFKRLHNREDYEGSGLGLAIIKRLVDNAGGEITLDSAEGEGSVFNFNIPTEKVYEAML